MHSHRPFNRFYFASLFFYEAFSTKATYRTFTGLSSRVLHVGGSLNREIHVNPSNGRSEWNRTTVTRVSVVRTDHCTTLPYNPRN